MTMSRKIRIWPAAAGLIALAALAGCVREPNVATRSAAAIPHAHEGQEAATMQDGAGHEHGATASSVAVPAGQPAKTLSPDPLDSPADTSVADAQRSAEMAQGMSGGHGGHEGHGGHGATGTYRHADVGREPGAPEADEPAEPHHHHGAAPTAETDETAAVVYACPMHPEVTSNEPGTCSKCGMALVERREE